MDSGLQSHRTVLFHWQWNKKLLAIALIFLSVTVSLGFWQLERAELKRAILSAQKQRVNAPTIDFLSAVTMTENQFRNIIAVGAIDSKRVFLLDNKIRHGRPGYEVLALMKVSDNDSERWLLVNRGWLVGGVDRSSLPLVPPLANKQQKVTLSGYLYRSQGKDIVLEDEVWEKDQWPLVIQSRDIEKISRHLELDIYPYILRLVESSVVESENVNDQSASLETGWLVVNASPEKSVGYAVQWFSLALALLVLTIFANSNLAAVLSRNRRESRNE
jgi:cytochrome oxidase assembly protein ShyY1